MSAEAQKTQNYLKDLGAQKLTRQMVEVLTADPDMFHFADFIEKVILFIKAADN